MGWRAFRMPLTANTWVKSLVRIPRNPPKIETSLVTPFIRILGLPRPVDPAAPRLPRCQIHRSLASQDDEQRVLTGDLCFPKLAQEDLVIITEGISVPGPWRATSNVRRPGVRPIIARASTTSVVTSTICKSNRPFACHCPKVEATIFRALRASC